MQYAVLKQNVNLLLRMNINKRCEEECASDTSVPENTAQGLKGGMSDLMYFRFRGFS